MDIALPILEQDGSFPICVFVVKGKIGPGINIFLKYRFLSSSNESMSMKLVIKIKVVKKCQLLEVSILYIK